MRHPQSVDTVLELVDDVLLVAALVGAIHHLSRAQVSAFGDVEEEGGILIAGRGTGTDEVFYAVSSAEGSFEVGPLTAGEYEVWTCFEGFDELRFRLEIDSSSTADRVDLYLGPSEAAGRRDVVTMSEGSGSLPKG